MLEKPPIFKTVLNIYKFLFNNFFRVIYLAWPLISFYLLAIGIITLDQATTQILQPETSGGDVNSLFIFMTAIFAVIVLYLYVHAVIGWHRMCLQGPRADNFANPFYPQKNNIQFLGKTVLFYIILMLLTIAPMFLSSYFSSSIFKIFTGRGISLGIGMAMAISFMLTMYGFATLITARFMFYFPAKATGHYVTFRQSFKNFKGLTWRFAFTVFIAYLPCFITLIIFSSILNKVEKSSLPEWIKIVSTIGVDIPTGVLIQYISMPFLVIAVLCTFYKWRQENPL